MEDGPALPQGGLLRYSPSPPHLSPPQVWSQYEEPPVEDVVPTAEEKERTANYKPVFVTEVTDDLHFYVQDVETGEGQLGGVGLFRRTETAGGTGWGRGSQGGEPRAQEVSGGLDQMRLGGPPRSRAGHSARGMTRLPWGREVAGRPDSHFPPLLGRDPAGEVDGEYAGRDCCLPPRRGGLHPPSWRLLHCQICGWRMVWLGHPESLFPSQSEKRSFPARPTGTRQPLPHQEPWTHCRT